MADLTNIKVGDIVRISRGCYEILSKVTKVNKTTFVAGNNIFRKDNGNQYGGDVWVRRYASIPTQEDIERISTRMEKDALVNHIIAKSTYSNLSDFSIDTLREVNNLLQK